MNENGGIYPHVKPERLSIAPWPEPDPSVKIRVGEQWVDITRLGDILIRAGQELNAMFKAGTSDE